MFFSALFRKSRHTALCIGLFASLSLQTVVSNAMPVEIGKVSGVIQSESSAQLTFTRLPEAGLQVVPGAWETVATLHSENALPETSRRAAIATEQSVGWSRRMARICLTTHPGNGRMPRARAAAVSVRGKSSISRYLTRSGSTATGCTATAQPAIDLNNSIPLRMRRERYTRWSSPHPACGLRLTRASSCLMKKAQC